MRNLVISSVKAQTLLDSALTAQTEPYSPAAIALDLDERILYCARGLSGSQNSSQGSNSAPQVTLVKILPGRGPVRAMMFYDPVLIEHSCHSRPMPPC